MQRPWIKVAMGLKSNILPIAMRAEAQLAARGAHNPQAMKPHNHHVGFIMQDYNGMLNYLSAAGCLAWWHDSRFGCESSRAQFLEQPS
jgi:hypothetical protein